MDASNERKSIQSFILRHFVNPFTAPSSRLSVGELGRQLEDQIHQTEVLDRALVDRLKDRSGGPDAENANSSGNESGTDSGFDTFCSSGMHVSFTGVTVYQVYILGLCIRFK